MADIENARPIISRQAARLAGLTRYYTGIPCKRGHVAERYVSTSQCSLCQNAHRREYYHRDPAAETAKVMAYYWANRDEVRAKRNAYDKANPDKKRAMFKAWYDRNRDARAALKAAQRLADPETHKARYKRWAEANHEQVLANVRRRQVRKKEAVGRYTGAEIKALFKKQGGKCAYCRVVLKKGYHADHIIPISKGGSNWISNIQLTCSDCNHRKWAKDPIAWARQIGRLL